MEAQAQGRQADALIGHRLGTDQVHHLGIAEDRLGVLGYSGPHHSFGDSDEDLVVRTESGQEDGGFLWDTVPCSNAGVLLFLQLILFGRECDLRKERSNCCLAGVELELEKLKAAGFGLHKEDNNLKGRAGEAHGAWFIGGHHIGSAIFHDLLHSLRRGLNTLWAESDAQGRQADTLGIGHVARIGGRNVGWTQARAGGGSGAAAHARRWGHKTFGAHRLVVPHIGPHVSRRESRTTGGSGAGVAKARTGGGSGAAAHVWLDALGAESDAQRRKANAIAWGRGESPVFHAGGRGFDALGAESDAQLRKADALGLPSGRFACGRSLASDGSPLAVHWAPGRGPDALGSESNAQRRQADALVIGHVRDILHDLLHRGSGSLDALWAEPDAQRRQADTLSIGHVRDILHDLLHSGSGSFDALWAEPDA